MPRCRPLVASAAFFGVLAAGALLAGSLTPERIASSPLPTSASLQAPIVFEQNVGQTRADIPFLARGRGFTLSLNGSETRLALHSSKSDVRSEARAARRGSDASKLTQTSNLTMRLVGASPK